MDEPGDLIASRFGCRQLCAAEYEISDYALAFKIRLPTEKLLHPCFNVVRWYSRQLLRSYHELADALTLNDTEDNVLRVLYQEPQSDWEAALDGLARELCMPLPDVRVVESGTHLFIVELNGQQVAPGRYPALQRNAGVTRAV
ncbi:hypothetical protein BU15DRAFT_55479, partial [Melanogaster broomeanus]